VITEKNKYDPIKRKVLKWTGVCNLRKNNKASIAFWKRKDIKETLLVAEHSSICGRLPSWEWDWSKTRKHPARLMSQKRIAPSHPPVTKTHSLEVDHSTVITPSTIKDAISQLNARQFSPMS
jgi:hypothetical protein